MPPMATTPKMEFHTGAKLQPKEAFFFDSAISGFLPFGSLVYAVSGHLEVPGFLCGGGVCEATGGCEAGLF